MKYTASENLKFTTSLHPQALTTAQVSGAAIDARGFDEALVYVAFGAISGVTTPPTFTVQESDASGSGFATVTGAVLQYSTGTTAYASGDANKQYVGRIDLRKRKRYVRVITNTPSNTSWQATAGFVFGNAQSLPVSQAQALIAFSI